MDIQPSQEERVEEERTLDIVVTFEDDGVETGNAKGLFSRRYDEPRVRAISVSKLRDNFRETVSGVKEIFADLVDLSEDLPLKSVELSFEISTSGKVNLLGTGAEVAGKGAIKVSFGKK